MKKQLIDTIRAGSSVDDIFVLSEKSISQKKDGSNFLNVAVSDKSGTLKGVVWDNVDHISANFHSGDMVRVQGNVNEYRGDLQLVIKKIESCPIEMVDPADFMPTTTRSIEGMFETLLKLTHSLQTDYFKALLESFWQDESFVQRFKRAPAAKKMHHAYLGGLLEHTLSMALLADKIVGHYEGVDRELLITGTILHDIGKIGEFEYDIRIDYSDIGRLLNHIVIGIEMIEEKLKMVQSFPEEKTLLLKHMIVSHHGAREFGSPEPPKTIEAVLLNYIDEIDAKVNGIRSFIAKEDPGETWTAYHRVLERHFYRGKE